jgi:hypothetical protein
MKTLAELWDWIKSIFGCDKDKVIADGGSEDDQK